MINITESAANKLKELMLEKDSDGKEYDQLTVGLRVFVQGGGCSGFQYGMQIENEPQENDLRYESNGVKICVDPISIRYLNEAVVDFTENSSGGGFSIKNPNAKSTCGCGSSFEA